MFDVRVDPEKNRLYVTLRGHLEADERKEAAKAFLAAIAQLRNGFDIVDDIAALHPTDTDGLRDLVRAQSAAKIKGLRSVVRIVKIPLARLQLERMAQETGWEYSIAGTLEEADQRLDALGPPPPAG
jgi:hypothetical protein